MYFQSIFLKLVIAAMFLNSHPYLYVVGVKQLCNWIFHVVTVNKRLSGLYYSPGVQDFIYKVLGFSQEQSRSMNENIWLITWSRELSKLFYMF